MFVLTRFQFQIHKFEVFSVEKRRIKTIKHNQ